MRPDLHGRRALVLGAPGTVPTAVVEALSACGATVDAAVPGASAGPGFATREAALAAAADTLSASGSPDLLVNISATAGLPDSAGASAEEAAWFANATRAFAPSVARVVNVISVAGLVPLRGAAVHSAHHAALASLTRNLAMELAPDVLVNALAIGALGTDGGRLLSHAPLKRAAAPAEIGAALLFLVAPRNTYTTGHVMAVDGGWSIGYARNF